MFIDFEIRWQQGFRYTEQGIRGRDNCQIHCEAVLKFLF